MKKQFILVFLLLAGIYTITAQQPGLPSSQTALIKGRISPDSENENGNPDPKYKPSSLPSMQEMSLPDGNSKRLAELTNGLKLISDAMNRLVGEDYSFTLLSQHKYMVNNCLGLKASAGQFSIRFKMPAVSMDGSGKVVVRLTVDRIDLDALKIRMRPCPKDLQCHFSGIFEVGGVAKEISLTIIMDPKVYFAASTGVCALAFQGEPFLKWNIGALNLKPLQNNLDDMARQMIEDALNGGTLNVLYLRFIKLAKEMLPAYFEACKEVYTSPGDLVDGIGKVSNKPDEKTGQQNDSAAQWETRINKEIRGSTGRLVVQPPATGSMILHLFQPGQTKHFDAWYASKTANMMPGTYDIRVNNIWLRGVPIEKGKDTHLKLGVLLVPFDGSYTVLLPDGSVVVRASGKEKRQLVLPAGKYRVQVMGGEKEISITGGSVLEL